MDRDEDAGYRLRLEGRAERLDTARIRLTALSKMLQAFRWKSRLRENTALLRETAADQLDVEEALAAVARRAKAEGWAPDSPVMATAAEVERLSNRVASLALKRLGVKCRPEDLSQRLEHLELLVLGEPRLVLPGQRWKTALDALPPTHPDVRRAGHFADVLERLFKRPMQPSARIPFTLAEVDALIEVWSPGQRALAAVWTRLENIDAAGTLSAFLRRRATSTPLQPARNGAEQVLAAEFWSRFAVGRLREMTLATVAPVSCGDAELLEVLRWLVQRQTDADARLPATPVISDARAGLMELAVELATRPKDKGWKRLADRAQRAQPAAGEADYQKLQDNLRLFLRMVQRTDKTPAVYRAVATLPHAKLEVGASEPETLVDLVAAMERKLAG